MFRAAHAHPHRPSEPIDHPIDHHDLVLQPRDVTFDWGATPLHWLPGEPFATHTFDVLHLMLPELERWFVRTFEQALPLITDDRLREDVRGFIGQEAMHAEAHQEVLEHLLTKGLDPAPYTLQSEWIFRRVLENRPELTAGRPSRTSSNGSPSSRPSSTSPRTWVTGFSATGTLTGLVRTPRCSICSAGTARRRSNTVRSRSTCWRTSTPGTGVEWPACSSPLRC